MSEMVDRVAAILAEAGMCEVTDGGGSIAACVGPCQCRTMARAAIEAMREPNEEMIEAGSGGVGEEEWRSDVAEAWRAMIDFALAGKP